LPDEEQRPADVKVEELSLEDLEDQGEQSKAGGATTGGFTAGAMGPEGARYVPPMAPRRRTWKPLVAAVALLLAAAVGIYGVGYQLALETLVSDQHFTLQGFTIDKAKYDNLKEVDVPFVNVTIKGTDIHLVTDAKGKFSVPDLRGGQYTIHFYAREWDRAINTTYTTYIFGDYKSAGQWRNFPVKVTDLDPKATQPTSPFQPSMEARVLAWPTADTVTLQIRASSFDRPLDNFTLMFRESSGGYGTIAVPYHDTVDYTFTAATGSADYSVLFAKMYDPSGGLFINETRIPIPAHPAGAGGWRSVGFPDVAAFVQGGNVTNGTSRSVVVHSNGATECSYRLDGGAWSSPAAPLTSGEAELTVPFPAPLAAGDHLLEVVARNASIEGTPRALHVLVDREMPVLAPTVVGGKAVSTFAELDLQTEGASYVRYSLPAGGWVPWQLVESRILVPLADTGSLTTSAKLQVMDLAGNVATSTVNVTYEAIPLWRSDEYGQYVGTLRVCVPVMVIGVILCLNGAWCAWKRRRPGMAMLGAIGALLASGLGIVGAVLAVVALATITLSRDEFEEAGKKPPPLAPAEDAQKKGGE
jgi:hypothetical protein